VYSRNRQAKCRSESTACKGPAAIQLYRAASEIGLGDIAQACACQHAEDLACVWLLPRPVNDLTSDVFLDHTQDGVEAAEVDGPDERRSAGWGGRLEKVRSRLSTTT
jgi:hypothetical protein